MTPATHLSAQIEAGARDEYRKRTPDSHVRAVNIPDMAVRGT